MKKRLPDFAGVALVDILANGVAILIIVIVISIAARVEREQRYSEQVEEISTVMSRKFSTSLVLNQLAASRPARLHDYENSPLDQNLGPNILPILELHHDYVREFYSGQVWTRNHLLLDPNQMDDWLRALGADARRRLRIDIYDIAQFYLALSILREYDVRSAHWHFIGGRLSPGAARHCPPGVSAADCIKAGGATGADLPQGADLPDFAQLLQGGEPNAVGDDAGWPAFGEGASGGRPGGQAGRQGIGDAGVPGGVSIGDGAGVARNPFGDTFGDLGGFGENGQYGLLDGAVGAGGGQPGGQPGGRLRMRMAGSGAQTREQPLDTVLGEAPTRAQLLGAILRFVGNLQNNLDAGTPPNHAIGNFQQQIIALLRAPLALTNEEQWVVQALVSELDLAGQLLSDDEDLEIQIADEKFSDNRIAVWPNRLLLDAQVQLADDARANFPARARPMISLNTYPDMWRGSQVSLARDSILLLPPHQTAPRESRWRAVAHIAPQFDDFIIGFVHAAVDEHGKLLLHGEDNRVWIDGVSLRRAHAAPTLGARGWLLALYILLGAGVLGLLLVRARQLLPQPRQIGA